jgi:hypothetical protein
MYIYTNSSLDKMSATIPKEPNGDSNKENDDHVYKNDDDPPVTLAIASFMAR